MLIQFLVQRLRTVMFHENRDNGADSHTEERVDESLNIS